MKRFILVLLVILSFATLSPDAWCAGKTRVKGYTKKDGTYVAPHSRTSPNKSKSDNWSTKGNTNPNTGKKGTVDPDKKKK